MSEIVNINIGTAGCSIGLSLWELFSSEHSNLFCLKKLIRN